MTIPTVTLTIILPDPKCTYADHSYPAYSRKQVEAILTEEITKALENAGQKISVGFKTQADINSEKECT